MTDSSPMDHLNSRFLDGLAMSERESVLNAATIQRFHANSVVTNQGQPADHLFLLTKGRGRSFFITEEGEKRILLWLPAGEIIGVRTLLPVSSSYVASAEALKESWVLMWDCNTIRGLAARYPRLLNNALLIASEYLAEHMESYIALTCHNARQRLVHVLTTIAPSIGRKVLMALNWMSRMKSWLIQRT
jgi:CRP/FNR family transcriptional regulator, nitrogen oxide reductase regulator